MSNNWFALITEEGRRERWPSLYRARDQKRFALAHGAIPDESDLGHNVADPYCQYGMDSTRGRQTTCSRCYPQ